MLRLLASVFSVLIEKYGVDPVVESEAKKRASCVQKANWNSHSAICKLNKG